MLISLAQADLPNFPYSLYEIKVLSIDARLRETVQPRIKNTVSRSAMEIIECDESFAEQLLQRPKT